MCYGCKDNALFPSAPGYLGVVGRESPQGRRARELASRTPSLAAALRKSGLLAFTSKNRRSDCGDMSVRDLAKNHENRRVD